MGSLEYPRPRLRSKKHLSPPPAPTCMEGGGVSPIGCQGNGAWRGAHCAQDKSCQVHCQCSHTESDLTYLSDQPPLAFLTALGVSSLKLKGPGESHTFRGFGGKTNHLVPESLPKEKTFCRLIRVESRYLRSFSSASTVLAGVLARGGGSL